MTLHPPSHRTTNDASAHEISVALLLALAVIALMVIATATIGVYTAAPSFEIAPDPAGLTIPF